MEAGQDQRIVEAIHSHQGRLRNFIRRRVPDLRDVEDILQDVFYELIEAYRLPTPIEHAGAWLFRVARNRITDLVRRKQTVALGDSVASAAGSDAAALEKILPSPEAGPDEVYARGVLIEELEEALEELPPEQREVFIAHEVEGRSFREIAAETGVPVNTLLSRKHYAVVHLRRRLQDIYDEFKKGQGQEP